MSCESNVVVSGSGRTSGSGRIRVGDDGSWPCCREAESSSSVMTSTAEADISRHLAGLRAFREATARRDLLLVLWSLTAFAFAAFVGYLLGHL